MTSTWQNLPSLQEKKTMAPKKKRTINLSKIKDFSDGPPINIVKHGFMTFNMVNICVQKNSQILDFCKNCKIVMHAKISFFYSRYIGKHVFLFSKANQVCDSCLVAARAVRCRSRLAGTQQYHTIKAVIFVTVRSNSVAVSQRILTKSHMYVLGGTCNVWSLKKSERVAMVIRKPSKSRGIGPIVMIFAVSTWLIHKNLHAKKTGKSASLFSEIGP